MLDEINNLFPLFAYTATVANCAHYYVNTKKHWAEERIIPHLTMISLIDIFPVILGVGETLHETMGIETNNEDIIRGLELTILAAGNVYQLGKSALYPLPRKEIKYDSKPDFYSISLMK